VLGTRTSIRSLAAAVVVAAAATLPGCGGSGGGGSSPSTSTLTTASRPLHGNELRDRIPPLLDPHDVYAADRAGDLSPVARAAVPMVYVPNSESNTVTEIDPSSHRIVRQFPVGRVPQHIVPSYDLRTLWVTNDASNSLTPIDPRTGRPGRAVTVTDPYNLYFTPDGRYAVVMAERLREVNFLDAHTLRLHRSVSVPQCAGVNHADYTADGRYMFVSCEFGSAMIVLDVAAEKVVRTVSLPAGSSPQDVKLSPDGAVFYVADLYHDGLWVFDARTFRRIAYVRTGAGAHGLYPSRDARYLYISNRSAGTVSVLSFAARRVVATWKIPGGGSPDMGNVSADGRVLWLSGRYHADVYAFDTISGKLLARIPVGFGPHGVCVWPQPGRYSLGHTGIMR